MDSVDRNGPCPCGSGRKVRDCCGEGDEARLSSRIAANTRDSALSKLLAFAFQPSFDRDHEIAEVLFWGELARNTPSAGLQWLMESDEANVKYNAWFLFDWQFDGDETVVRIFLEEDDVSLTDAEREFLVRISAVPLRLYEVESVHRGLGVRLVDLWTGRRVFVVERTASNRIVTWDLLGARVAADGLGGLVFEGGLYVYPAEQKTQIVSHFRRLHRKYRRARVDGDIDGFFRHYGMVFHHLWLKLVALPEPPPVTTPEGEPLMFCRAVYDAPRLDDVRALIAASADVRPLPDGRFAWFETAPGGRQDLGRWSLDGGRLILETTSRGRVARGRAWLEGLAGALVTYRATRLESVDRTLHALRYRGIPPASRSAVPAEDAGVRELYDRHYQGWLDRPDPELGNRTPRSAARTRLWRPRLLDRLKRLENSADRGALAGRPPYDFTWIWKELGLDRP